MKWTFPFKDTSINITRESLSFKGVNFENLTEIPVSPHPGGFGVKRKHHIHKGVDLYCNPDEAVYAVEDGVVAKRGPFTGTLTKTEWWNDTEFISIQNDKHSILYGEIAVGSHLKDGDTIKQGEFIGRVKTVLKKDKGRPMTMLHFELYERGIIEAHWGLGERPAGLLNPTGKLIEAAGMSFYHYEDDGEWAYVYDYSRDDANYQIIEHNGAHEFLRQSVALLNREERTK